MVKLYFKRFDPEQPKRRPKGPPPPPAPTPELSPKDWAERFRFKGRLIFGTRSQAEKFSKRLEPWPKYGFVENQKQKQRTDTERRIMDVLTGVGIGLFIGIVGTLIFISQLGQFAN